MNMIKANVSNRIYNCGAMAVIRVETIERGLEIAKGCIEGGVDVLEISYTNVNAGEVISAIKKTYGDAVCIGAGTVMDSETARHAIMSGAQFIVANMLSVDVAKMCNRYQIPYAPGCSTVTEAIQGLTYGAAFIKAFPISDMYGPKVAKLFKTPTPFMPILASGGITLDNLHEFITNGVECCGIGTLLTKGTSDEIAENAKKIREIIDNCRSN